MQLISASGRTEVLTQEESMATDKPKFQLKKGLRATNITVTLSDGTRKTVTVEPGKMYEGDEYIQWCPMVLSLVESKVTIEALKAKYQEPVVGQRLVRRNLRPPLSGPTLSPKAVIRKVDAEAQRGQFPKDIPAEAARPPRRPRPAVVEKKPVPKEEVKAGVDTSREKAKLEKALSQVGNITKPKLLELAKTVGMADKVKSSDTKGVIEKTLTRELKRKIAALG